jgi:hypothetical protein
MTTPEDDDKPTPSIIEGAKQLKELYGNRTVTTPEKAARADHWRQKLTELGGWDNGLVMVPASGVRLIIEDLLAAEARIRVLGDLIALADNLAHGVFKAGSKADTERNRHNAANLCNAIAKERNSGGALD